MTPRDAARAELGRLTSTLLDRQAGPGPQRDAALALFELCARWSGSDPQASLGPPLALAHGIALAPGSAARCVLDFARTARFLQGVHAAIDAALARFGPPVDVLYAGCGPFAPLCLPLTTQVPAGAARFTLLEVQPDAAQSARRLCAALGAEAWVERIETTDALQWRATRAPHVIVVEAMQKALAREPQVALTAHLAPQLAERGFFVPEEIRVQACLSELGHEFDAGGPRRLDLGLALRLRADECRERPPAFGTLRTTAPSYAGAPRSLLVLTHVRVFGELVLGDYDSAISYPTVLRPPTTVAPGARLELSYEGGPEPGLRGRVLD